MPRLSPQCHVCSMRRPPSKAALGRWGPARKALTFPAMLNPSSRWSCLPLFHPQLPIHSKQLRDRIAGKSWRFRLDLLISVPRQQKEVPELSFVSARRQSWGGGGGRCGSGADSRQERRAAAEGRPWEASCRGIRFTSFPFPLPRAPWTAGSAAAIPPP